MPNSEYTYSVPFKVRSYEVDHNKESTISAICNYFQEAAGLHASQLDFDISDLQKKGLTWVLYKLQVKVHEYPKRWESVQVNTWPSTGDGLRAYRDYELYNENDELLAVGLSQWMVVDVRKKRPVKMPDDLMSNRFKTDRHVLDLHKNNLMKLAGDKATFVTTAGLNDLDMNKHVNNVRYIDWMTGYQISEITQKKCREITIQYTAETKAGDKIYLVRQENPNLNGEVNCTLFKNDDKQIIAKARTIWSS
jgi:acyl-ACP thioesterase